MKNRLLHICALLIQFSSIICLVGLGFLVLFGGYVLITDADSIRWLEYSSSGLTFSTESPTEQEYPPFGILAFYLLKTVVSLLITYLILRTSLKVVQSIQSLETFHNRNIIYFRKIGHFAMVLFLLNVFSLSENGDSLQFTVELRLWYLLAALICYILSEIFKEGNSLLEESKLTI